MAQMSQADVDAWIAAHGGRDLQHGVEQKQVKNPSYNPDKGPRPGNEEYTTVEVETWTNSKTGAKFSAKHLPDNSWDRYDAVDGDPNKPPTGKTPDETAATQATTAHTQATTASVIKEEAEKDANAAAGRGRLTDAAWTAELARKESAARAAGQQDLANQIAKDRLAFDKEKDGRPEVKIDTKEVNGQTYFVQTTVSKDGKTPPVIKTYDGAGKEVPGGLPGAAGLPEGMPQFRPDFNHPDGGWGLIDYSNQLLELQRLGKLTEKQRADLIQQAHNATTATAGRLDTIRAQQQQLQSNEINQRNTDAQVSSQRLNSANAATNDALTQSMKMAGAHTPDSYAKGGGAILPAIMALQAQNAAAYGGMNQPARVGTQGYPVLNQLAGQTIPAVNALTTPVAPAGTGAPPPAVAPPAAPTAPQGASMTAGPVQGGGPAFAPRPVAPSPAPGPQAPASTPQPPALPRTAEGNTPEGAPLNIRHKQTGAMRTVSLQELNSMPDRDQYDILDPNSGAAINDGVSVPATNLKPDSAPTAEPGLPPGSTVLPYQPPVPIPYPDNAGAQSMMQPQQTLPAVNNMTWIGNVMGQRPQHASEADWQAAVRQAAQEAGMM